MKVLPSSKEGSETGEPEKGPLLSGSEVTCLSDLLGRIPLFGSPFGGTSTTESKSKTPDPKDRRECKEDCGSLRPIFVLTLWISEGLTQA